VIQGVKVDLVHFKYAFHFPIIDMDSVRLADMRDVAPLKLDAVTKRGSKNDFYSMFFLLERFSLQQILDWCTQMYRHATSFHVIKSLPCFEDAAQKEGPIVFAQK
jgi:hypothetical protein